MINMEDTNIVISSRVRFARNFEGYAFPQNLSNEKCYQIIERVKRTISDNNISLKEFNYIDMEGIEPIYKMTLVEKHIISPEFFNQKRPSAIVLSSDEIVGIMINEEDHLRIQCIFKGINLVNALVLCMETESMLEKNNKFAFSEKLGYLTSCPTNIGTGLRASVMMHLPALTLTGYINDIIKGCTRLGLTVRGMYGENTGATGDIYQVSNQKTLGMSEEGIVNNVINVVAQIVDQESNLRYDIYDKNKHRFEDKVMRAYGILKNAKLISSEESLRLISDIRWACDIGIIKDISREKLDFLFTAISSGFIQKTVGIQIDSEERDFQRALILREVFDNN